jgi:excisionase family DNA binding protein
MPIELLTVAEAAQRCRLSPSTVYRRVQAGTLEATRLGYTPKAPIRIPERAVKARIDLDEDN